MDENKEFEEVIEEVVSEVEEAEAAVEQAVEEVKETVEEIKEELTGDTQETVEEVEAVEDEDIVQEVKDAVNDVKEGLKQSLSTLLGKLDEVDLSEEKLKGYLNDFSANVNKLVGQANDKVKEIKDDPKTTEYWNKAKETYSTVSSTVSTKVKEAYAKAEENETFKSTMDKVSGACVDAYENASEKYQEFIHDPKVQETVTATAEKAKELFGKITEAVKSVITKEEEKEKEE